MKSVLQQKSTGLSAVDSRAITEQELAPALEAALRQRFDASVLRIATTRRRWPKGRGI